MTWPKWIAARTKDSDTKKSATTNHIPSPYSKKRSRNSNSGKMVLWDTSPPSSLSASFLNKVTIPCPSNLSLDLLAYRVGSSMSLDLVTVISLCWGRIMQVLHVHSPTCYGDGRWMLWKLRWPSEHSWRTGGLRLILKDERKSEELPVWGRSSRERAPEGAKSQLHW